MNYIFSSFGEYWQTVAPAFFVGMCLGALWQLLLSSLFAALRARREAKRRVELSRNWHQWMPFECPIEEHPNYDALKARFGNWGRGRE